MLPTLPKKIKNKEAKFGITFRHWVMANYKSLDNCTFEIKQTEKDSIPFSALEDHQRDFSMAIKHGEKGVLIRVEAGTIGAPDYVYLKKIPAWIVVKYPLGFVILDIDKLNTERIMSKRKSLTWERAQAIAYKII